MTHLANSFLCSCPRNRYMESTGADYSRHDVENYDHFNVSRSSDSEPEVGMEEKPNAHNLN